MNAVSPRPSRIATVSRVACAIVALVSGLALATQSGLFRAAADDSSAVTVSWTGGTGAAAAYQPHRDTANAHYSRLSNISVTVDQTKNLIDQAVRVKVSGFRATQSFNDAFGVPYANAANFVQAMQCWGPDPLAADFYQTCAWGANYGNVGFGPLVESDTLLRVANVNLNPPTTATKPDPDDVPFRAVDGSILSGRQQAVAGANGASTTTYPLFSAFTPATTNEVPGARINRDGTGTFEFETQNSDTAPQLGCGTNGHLRCWLVVVPRDDVYGGKPAPAGTCSSVVVPDTYEAPAYGASGLPKGGTQGIPQSGSPVNPACDYWENRVVVPLDFTPTGLTCPKGSTERRTLGSDLLVSAMASWQPKLCADTGSIYSFDTNPDALSRSQLLEGQVGMAFTPGPITAAETSDADRDLLKTTDISYAPVAATSAVVAFTADGRNGLITQLRLTPRLVAKLLTQSYSFTVPHTADDTITEPLHLPAKNRSYVSWSDDPDFRAVNPNYDEFINNPSVVLPGPSGDDVIAQLWKWIVADKDARAFLNGAADPWGMTVNPYYRAKGDPAAVVPTFDTQGNLITKDGAPVTKAVGLVQLDGSPLKLGDTPPLNFPKSDDTTVPHAVQPNQYPFGSIQAAPYAQDFVSGSRSTFRANPGGKTKWDPNVLDASGKAGAWVSEGPQVPGQRFTLAFTDAPSAALYDLGTASLSLDNQPTVFADPTDQQVSGALASSALQPTSVASVSQLDPSKVVAGQYPLSSLVYAAVNLTASDKAARSDFAKLIRQVTSSGQVPGSAVGQLPPGYVPLTSSLVTQSTAAATAILSYVPKVGDDGSGDDGGYAMDDGGGYGFGYGADGSADSQGTPVTGSDGTKGTISAQKASYRSKTPNAGTPWVMQVILVAGLIGGVLGSLLTPLFFRRRPIG